MIFTTNYNSLVMKRYLLQLIIFLVIFSILLTACTSTSTPNLPAPPMVSTPSTPTPISSMGDILYVNLVWHQHQPLYYKDADGVYTRPWVRVHATKDYYDMASTLAKYPDIHATINLTPVLIRQLDDFAAGTKDKYWVLAEKPANSLTDEEKTFILTRFFDANWDNIIRIHPGYKTLLDKRGGTDEAAISDALKSFNEQDFRDLQVWFNLAWIDPDFLGEEPLNHGNPVR